MRFLFLTPGTGHFYCGSCLRDDALAKALIALGHDVVVAPMYLPLVLEEGRDTSPVHMGGINMYLQQKISLARRVPRWMTRWLDHPALLRWVSRRQNMTEAPDLGAMTVSMLRGEEGRQAREVESLVEWVRSVEAPDVIVLSNVLLLGVARRLRERVGRPVVCTMQGEAPFLDALPESWRDQAWAVLAERAVDVDLFIAVSRFTAKLMSDRLGLATDRVHVVPNGIALDDFSEGPVPLADRGPPTIGFLSRMCRPKGLDTLIRATRQLHARGSVPGLRVRLCGVMLDEDRAFVEEAVQSLRSAGVEVDVIPNATRAEKLAFLKTLSVLSVPATYGESFGLYLLEAMAAGVPVVQPDHGAFPEVLEATGGGVLCAADDDEALADGLEAMLLDPRRADDHGRRGHAAVHDRFSASVMARAFLESCTMLRPGSRPPGRAEKPPMPEGQE